jgi:hypothetical protein
MPHNCLRRRTFGQAIAGAIAGDAHNRHQIGVLTLGVQLGAGRVTADLQAAPDPGADSVEPDAAAGDKR